MCPKDADGIANSIAPDQTALLVWSGSAVFAQTYLSKIIMVQPVQSSLVQNVT